MDILTGGGLLLAQGRCPMCAGYVSLRKRDDSVYCSPRCRTRAWRARKAGVVTLPERPLQEASPGDA
ncbi:hypothetical protein GCM10009612_76790 [Streptomyces beijiangensis]